MQVSLVGENITAVAGLYTASDTYGPIAEHLVAATGYEIEVERTRADRAEAAVRVTSAKLDAARRTITSLETSLGEASGAPSAELQAEIDALRAASAVTRKNLDASIKLCLPRLTDIAGSLADAPADEAMDAANLAREHVSGFLSQCVEDPSGLLATHVPALRVLLEQFVALCDRPVTATPSPTLALRRSRRACVVREAIAE